MYDIFYISKTKDSEYFKDLEKRIPLLKLAKYENTKDEAFFYAQKKSLSKFFWIIDETFITDTKFDFSYKVSEWDENYIHVFKQENNSFGGVYLIPKKYKITKNEAEFTFFINKKELDIVAGSFAPYEKFPILSPEDYFIAQKKCQTDMFYAIDSDYKPLETFNFNFIVKEYDKKYVHVWKNNNNEYDGMYLIPKNYPITKKETEYNFFINKKEIDEVSCSLIPFEIVFISYNEPNADKNYDQLKLKFPNSKRIHGIKGIHQAHKAAAELVNTRMFWVVDGDAILKDTFNFDYYVSKWDRQTVHVFRSQNPINELSYGYGGVKLLPTKLVLDMNMNSVDMTTSISKSFKSVDIVSNITEFNTDPFNTWKSAFRECVKLKSKIINGQIDSETQDRLDIWCKVGNNKPYGEYAIKGALKGTEFGQEYSDNKEMLSKINDWNWLKNKFEEEN